MSSEPQASPGAEPGPSRSPRPLGAILLAAAAGLTGLGFWLFLSAPEPKPVAAEGAPAALPQVETLQLEPRPVRRVLERSGVIQARRRVELVSETQGPVTALGADELDAVEAGQVLVEVDPLLADVAVERALAAVARAESQLRLARSESRRFENLAGQDAVSASRRDRAVSDAGVAEANLREARAGLVQARDQRSKKTLRAPFAGVLAQFPVEVGETLRVGERVAVLLDLTTARVEVGVSDREVVALHTGAEAIAELEAWPGEQFRGTVLRLGAAADEHNKRFPVQIELPNPDRRLLPGMLARVQIDLGERPLRTVPRSAVWERQGLRFVYVVAEEGGAHVARSRRVVVRELPFLPTQLELVSGVESGERIAISPLAELRDGTEVRLKQAVAEGRSGRPGPGDPS